MNINLLDAGVLAGLGYGTVFLGLIMLMVVITVVGKIFASKKTKKEAPVEAAPVEVVPQEPVIPMAPGTAGQLKLYDTPPKTAAMLMAIVADKMGKPLNELRFISIKEVK